MGNKYVRKTATEEEVIQAARWFVSLTGNTEQTTEYIRLQNAVQEYNKRNPEEPIVQKMPKVKEH